MNKVERGTDNWGNKREGRERERDGIGNSEKWHLVLSVKGFWYWIIQWLNCFFFQILWLSCIPYGSLWGLHGS